MSSCWQIDPVAVASGDDDYISPVFVRSATTITAVKYWIRSGTSATVTLNACTNADTPDCTTAVTGFTNAATVTPTSAGLVTLSTPYSIAAGGGFQIVVSAISGAPRNMTYCVYLN